MSAKKTTKPARAPVQGREARILDACVRVLGDTPKARDFAASLIPLHKGAEAPRDHGSVEGIAHRAPGDVEREIAAVQTRQAASRRKIVAAARALQKAVDECGAHYLDEVGQQVAEEVEILDEDTGEFVAIGQRFVPSEFTAMLSALVRAMDERKRRRGRPHATGVAANRLWDFMRAWNRIVQEPIVIDANAPFREALREVGPEATGLDYLALKKAFERMAKDEWAFPAHWRTGGPRPRHGLPPMATFRDPEPGQK